MGLILLYRRGFYITPWNYVTCRNVMSRRIVMTTHEVMCDIRYTRQEEALWLAQGGGDNPPGELRGTRGDESGPRADRVQTCFCIVKIYIELVWNALATWLKCALWGISLPYYAVSVVWERQEPILLNKWFNCNPELFLTISSSWKSATRRKWRKIMIVPRHVNLYFYAFTYKSETA